LFVYGSIKDGRLLWDFLQQLLNDHQQRYSNYIAWKCRDTGVFKIVDPAGLAKVSFVRGFPRDGADVEKREYFQNYYDRYFSKLFSQLFLKIILIVIFKNSNLTVILNIPALGNSKEPLIDELR
jgi:hypothetical protein